MKSCWWKTKLFKLKNDKTKRVARSFLQEKVNLSILKKTITWITQQQNAQETYIEESPSSESADLKSTTSLKLPPAPPHPIPPFPFRRHFWQKYHFKTKTHEYHGWIRKQEIFRFQNQIIHWDKKWLSVIWKVGFESAIDVSIYDTDIGRTATIYMFACFHQ